MWCFFKIVLKKMSNCGVLSHAIYLPFLINWLLWGWVGGWWALLLNIFWWKTVFMFACILVSKLCKGIACTMVVHSTKLLRLSKVQDKPWKIQMFKKACKILEMHTDKPCKRLRSKKLLPLRIKPQSLRINDTCTNQLSNLDVQSFLSLI